MQMWRTWLQGLYLIISFLFCGLGQQSTKQEMQGQVRDKKLQTAWSIRFNILECIIGQHKFYLLIVEYFGFEQSFQSHKTHINS